MHGRTHVPLHVQPYHPLGCAAPRVRDLSRRKSLLATGEMFGWLADPLTARYWFTVPDLPGTAVGLSCVAAGLVSFSAL
jgi:hypothetical protein